VDAGPEQHVIFYGNSGAPWVGVCKQH
jgi:hypothetical protein